MCAVSSSVGLLRAKLLNCLYILSVHHERQGFIKGNVLYGCYLLYCFFLMRYLSFRQNVDMSGEMASESMEVITMAVDKHAQTKNYEVTFLHKCSLTFWS
jgi:hypothetical protein